MSVTHPSGSDLESMNEFYDKKILRAVTLHVDLTCNTVIVIVNPEITVQSK